MICVSDRPNLDVFIEKYGDDYPLLKEFKNTEQDREWHAEGNVHIHTDMVLEAMYDLLDESRLPERVKTQLMFAAAFHDYGKPLTTKPVERPDGMHVGAPKHEEVGASLLINSRVPEELNKRMWIETVKLIGHHQMPKKLVLKEGGYGDYVRVMHDVSNLLYLSLLEKADMIGRTCDDSESNMTFLELFESEYKDHGIDRVSNLRIEDVCYEWPDEKYYFGIRELGKRISSLEEVDSLPFNYEDYSSVTILCGLPGSGKTTYRNQLSLLNPSALIISLDDMREEFKGKLNDKGLLNLSRARLKQALREKRDVLVDATNYRRDFRTKISDLVMAYGGYVRIVMLCEDVNECIKRNNKRENPVPKEYIMKQFDKFQIPSFSECHELVFI